MVFTTWGKYEEVNDKELKIVSNNISGVALIVAAFNDSNALSANIKYDLWKLIRLTLHCLIKKSLEYAWLEATMFQTFPSKIEKFVCPAHFKMICLGFSPLRRGFANIKNSNDITMWSCCRKIFSIRPKIEQEGSSDICCSIWRDQLWTRLVSSLVEKIFQTPQPYSNT